MSDTQQEKPDRTLKTIADLPQSHTHNELVDSQFGSQAKMYLNSSVHATGKEFALVEQTVCQLDAPKVLDLGCGAGHISFCVAPFAEQVTAYDLSADMLQVVSDTANDKGMKNIATCQGVVESLPFDDNSFDMVVTRFSVHHWQNVPQALDEMRRVCKPKGIVMIIDIMAPTSPVCDTFLQTIEILRDNSHVRDYSVADWQTMLSLARLEVTGLQTHKLTLEFDSWIARMRTPQQFIIAIQALQQQIGHEVKDYFDVQTDGSFTTDVIVLIAKT